MEDFAQIPSANIDFPNNDVPSSDVDKVRPGSVDGPLAITQTSPTEPIMIVVTLPPNGVEVGEIKISPDDLLPQSNVGQSNVDSFTVSYKKPGDTTLYPLDSGTVSILLF